MLKGYIMYNCQLKQKHSGMFKLRVLLQIIRLLFCASDNPFSMFNLNLREHYTGENNDFASMQK